MNSNNSNVEDQGTTVINSDTSRRNSLANIKTDIEPEINPKLEENEDSKLLAANSCKDKEIEKPSVLLSKTNKHNIDIMDRTYMNKNNNDGLDQTKTKRKSIDASKTNHSSNLSVTSNDRSRSTLQLQDQNGRFSLYNNINPNINNTNNNNNNNNGNFLNADPNLMFYNQNNHFTPNQSSTLNMADQNPAEHLYLNTNVPFPIANNMGMTPSFATSPFTPVFNGIAASPFGNDLASISSNNNNNNINNLNNLNTINNINNNMNNNNNSNNNPNDNQRVVHVPVPIAVPVFMPFNSQNGHNPNDPNIMQQNMQMNQFNKLNSGTPLTKQQMDYFINQQQLMQFQNTPMGQNNFFSLFNNQNLPNINDTSRTNTPMTQLPLQFNNVQTPTATSKITTPKQGKPKKAKPQTSNKKKTKPSVTTLTITKDPLSEPDTSKKNTNIISNNLVSMERLKSAKDATTTPASDMTPTSQAKTPIENHNLLSELAIESLQRQRNQGKFIHLDPVPQFEDQKDVKLWLQKIFYPLGIEIAIERSDKFKITFKCKALKRGDEDLHVEHHRENKSVTEDLKGEDSKKRRVKSPFNTCPFRIRASYKSKSEKWQIVIINNSHSHQLKFSPTSVNYKQFKQTLREMNDIETIKKFDELEYKSKMNLPMDVDTIPCDCGLTEEVQSFGVVLPTSFTSGKQQNSAIARFTQKNSVKRSSAAGKHSDESDVVSNGSGVTKVKKQNNKNNKIKENLRKHVNMNSALSVDEKQDTNFEQCFNTEGGLMDFSEQLSKVDFFLAGQKSANIPDFLNLDNNKNIMSHSNQLHDQINNENTISNNINSISSSTNNNGINHINHINNMNTITNSSNNNNSNNNNNNNNNEEENNFLDLNMGVDEVDFTELFLKPHKKSLNMQSQLEILDQSLPATDHLDLENIEMQYNNSDHTSSGKNEELSKGLDGMHLFEDSKNGPYFF
ncbi:hypothetical protein ACO0SA_001011 [Hanseniaspora valbyensis]